MKCSIRARNPSFILQPIRQGSIDDSDLVSKFYLFIIFFQVFTHITKLVLRTKKEQQEKANASKPAQTVKLDHKKRGKKKCC